MNKKITFIAIVLLASTVMVSEGSDHPAEKNAGELVQTIAERVTLSGLVEVEAGSESIDLATGTDQKSSDIILATAQLGFGIEVTETISGDLIFLYEEGAADSQIEVDEAALNYDNEQYFARVGRQYVPFGIFVSNFISDPIVLELGETQAGAVLVGGRYGQAELALFAFNGEADKVGDDDQINDFGASLTINAGEALELGASYMSDLADSGAELTLDTVNADERVYTERAAGWSSYLIVHLAALEVSAEVVAAADKLVDLGVDYDEPLAWNVELALTINDATDLAVRVEGANEIAGAPETQYGVCVTRGIAKGLSLSFEYLHGEFDEQLNPPPNDLDTRDVVTAQLALEF